jgi:hypothetical protein
VVRPVQSDRIIRIQQLAREASEVEWPDEEKTNPVIVNVMAPTKTPVPATAPDTIDKAADGLAKVTSSVKTWMQVVTVGFLVAGAVAVAIVWLLTR